MQVYMNDNKHEKERAAMLTTTTNAVERTLAYVHKSITHTMDNVSVNKHMKCKFKIGKRILQFLFT